MSEYAAHDHATERLVARLRLRLQRARPLVDAVGALHASIDPGIEREALAPALRELLEAWDEYLRVEGKVS